jgi:hypothetical protein
MLDDFFNMKMNTKAKLYLRLFELFAHETPMKIVSNKEDFIKKYVSVYPSHLNFEEKFTVKEKTIDLPYFFRVPSIRKRINK